MVSQSSANVSTSAPAESTSASTSKETESKDGGSGEATDSVNTSSNESTVKPLKETDNLKRPIVEEDEEVKPKKRKEDHSQSSKGDLLFWGLIKFNESLYVYGYYITINRFRITKLLKFSSEFDFKSLKFINNNLLN